MNGLEKDSMEKCSCARMTSGRNWFVSLQCVPQSVERILSQALKVVKRNDPRDRIKLLRRNNPHKTKERPTLSSTEHSRIRREIAIMKRCRHANIAKLFEVIDDPQHDKIYLG